MQAYSKPIEELLNELKVDRKTGLTAAEVTARREKYGENKLREAKKKTTFQRFLDQFKDVMILILIAAAVVSFVVVCAEQNWGELFEPALILLIVILNAVMGVVQESKAEKALDALKNLSAPHARVIRDGKEMVVEAAELVPGDIIHLEAGDFVPADARLLQSAGLKSEESALTGESVPSEKDATALVEDKAPLGDRHNMVYSGCSITYGTATAVVTATGMDTEMGKIANLLDGENDGQTPLQKKLADLGKYLGIVALAACAVIFVVGILNGIPVLEIFMTSVSLAVSAIPEGLPAIVTIVLSIGVQRMVKKNALIRRLPAVETLGSASIICSDKTGTLTQNRMTLVKTYVDGEGEAMDLTVDPGDSARKLLRYGTLCCDGSVVFHGDQVSHIGDPTETAIVLAAHNCGMPKEELAKAYPRLGEIPFDSDRKLMSTIVKMDGKLVVVVKGAFDMMAKRCIQGDLARAKAVTEEMSENALRVLAVAYKEIEEIPGTLTSDRLENDLTFLGLVGMIDPPRPEAKAAVAVCRRAGIKPVMITGDHVVTASAIARELGILMEGDRAITGAELDAMSDRDLDESVEHISVYARVSPENKIRIVKAWQRKGQVVSMTGDGVNDAPALKAADIGCAMGITGTDVAKGAADMTLTDDNFATIVDAVREGRGIYANIKKVVGFLLGTNIGEVITVFLAMLLWHKTPLLSMQLLWVNLVTDSLPAIALGMEAVEPDVMDKKPKPRDEGIFAGGLGIRVVLQGIMFAALTLVAFKVGENVTGQLEGGQTLAFMVLALSQVVQAYNMRSDRSLFRIGPFGNKTLNLASLVSVVLMLVVLFTPVRGAFGLITLTPSLYLFGLGLILVPLVVMELVKLLGLLKGRKERKTGGYGIRTPLKKGYIKEITMIKTVLFDLDGTLLPMDQDKFTKSYFNALTRKLVSHGYEPMSLTAAIWTGTMAMIKNKGEDTNENLFWRVFEESYGANGRKDEELFADFYRNEFHSVKEVCGHQPKSAELVAYLRQNGIGVVLATNPIFPRVAVESRLAWAGIDPACFDLITSYENSSYCKPNPAYYREIARQLNLNPAECLMVGNDVSDDMPAASLGMEVFLLTDCLINKENTDISAFPHGNMDDLLAFLQKRI